MKTFRNCDSQKRAIFHDVYVNDFGLIYNLFTKFFK